MPMQTPAETELAQLLDLGPAGDLRTVAGLSAFLAARAMSPVTDRSSLSD